MDNLTSVCSFFENSPKRQKFLEYFIEYYKDELNLPDSKQKQIIGLSKTRWVERHLAYDTYYLLFKAKEYKFESIFQATYIYIMSFTCI